jgi:hypothetical protein
MAENMEVELVTFSELIDKLMIVNIKLYNVLERSSILNDKLNKTEDDVAEIVKLSDDNIKLVRQRSAYKNAIDRKLNMAIKKGETEALDEVKNYGKE